MEDEGGIPQLNQEELDELAATLDIQYAILDNLTGGHDTYTAAITIANKGETQLQFGNWAIYFSHIRMIEPEHLPCKGGVNLPGGLNLCHINGCFKIGASAVNNEHIRAATCSVILTQRYISNVHDKTPAQDTEAYHLQWMVKTAGSYLGSYKFRHFSGHSDPLEHMKPMELCQWLFHPGCTLRLSHRGNHVDVARNFHCKETIMRLLE
ncbi:hypothetical protein C0Q70_15187 [Pomacea canaliculata]|uniref:Uncharacterized protein n=1 Tax=Pomacea canaliculata TaxID=400727 RepID=A0A2T7NU68_POMCA|nr:hypothetical protein C0Q70_15187 [Pomacea canaliculata]